METRKVRTMLPSEMGLFQGFYKKAFYLLDAIAVSASVWVMKISFDAYSWKRWKNPCPAQNSAQSKMLDMLAVAKFLTEQLSILDISERNKSWHPQDTATDK